MNPIILQKYKSLKNYVHKMKLEQSLLAVHGHIQHQVFNRPLPADITAPIGYINAEKLADFREFGIYPWEIESLTKEIILHGSRYGGRKNMKQWHSVAEVVTKLKELEDEIAKSYTTTENILIELYRMAHRQFVWQESPYSNMARYWKIYNNPKMKPIFHRMIGLSIEEIYVVGVALTGFFMEKFALFYPPDIHIKNMSFEQLNKVINFISLPFDDLKRALAKEQVINEEYAYSNSSLKRYPLIKTIYEGKNALICPLPPLLFNRITQGIYYDIFSTDGDFSRAYGDSFQEYIGEVISEGNSRLAVIPETIYGKSRKSKKKSIDWIVQDNTAVLFIECKAKRLIVKAKSELITLNTLEGQLDILSDSIVQTYKNIRAYENNEYTHFPFISGKPIYPIVVTLEEWFVFGDKLLEIINQQLNIKFQKEQLDKRLLEKYPYSICSSQEIELLMQISQSVSLEMIFSQKTKDEEYRLWQLSTFLHNIYPEQLKKTRSLFKEQILDLIQDHM